MPNPAPDPKPMSHEERSKWYAEHGADFRAQTMDALTYGNDVAVHWASNVLAILDYLDATFATIEALTAQRDEAIEEGRLAMQGGAAMTQRAIKAEAQRDAATRRAELAEGVVRGVREIHKPSPEELVDEDAVLEGASEDESRTEVMVCAWCWPMIYPEGCDDEYVHPDVLWPCPTERAIERAALAAYDRKDSPQPTAVHVGGCGLAPDHDGDCMITED